MPIGASQAFSINVNCSNLARSLHFYRDLLGLTASVQTRPDAQDGAAYRLDRVQWDGWFLHDARGPGAGPTVDLLEWQVPSHTGTPNVAADLGLNRLGFYVADLSECYERAIAAGVTAYGAPHETSVEGSEPVRSVVIEDPDGVLVELVEVGVERVGFVAIGTSDLDTTRAFYEDVLGFHPMFDRPPVRQPGQQVGIDREIELIAAYYDDPRGEGAFMLELVQLLDPVPKGPAAREAHQLGMFRLAMLTDDIDRDYTALLERGVTCWTPPATVEMGLGLPPSRLLMFTDPDGAVIELTQP